MFAMRLRDNISNLLQRISFAFIAWINHDPFWRFLTLISLFLAIWATCSRVQSARKNDELKKALYTKVDNLEKNLRKELFDSIVDFIGLDTKLFYTDTEKEKLKNFQKSLTNVQNKKSLDHLILGNYHYSNNDFLSALAEYERILLLEPQNRWAWNNKGNALAKLGRSEEALDAYDKALALDPKFATAWSNKGNAFSDLRQYAKALDACEKALILDSKYAEAWNNKGKALFKLGRYEKAMEDLNKALSLDPTNVGIWIEKGNAFASLGYYDNALKVYEKILELTPNNKDAHCGIVRMFSKLKAITPALEWLEKSLQLGFNDFAWLREDADLDNLRAVPEFDELIEKYEKKQRPDFKY